MNNTVATDQNTPEMIRLLEAKSVAYDDAKKVNLVEWLSQSVSIITPIFIILAVPDFSEKYSLIVTSIFLGINAITFFISKKRTDEGANLQEEFDTDLFKIRWNETLCGDKIAINDTINLSKRFKSDYPQVDWYSIEIVPLIRHTNAILLCQDSNLVWDSDLRKKFIKYFSISAILYYVFFGIFLLYKNYTFNHSLALIAPTFPFIFFGIINVANIQDTVKEKKGLSQQIKNLFIHFKSTHQETGLEKIREIQDVIYATRKNGEKIPSWFYGIFKAKQGIVMDECTKENIRKYDLLS